MSGRLAGALATGVLALGLLSQKAVDLLLEIVLAFYWGTGHHRDAYLAASSVLLVASLLSVTLLPRLLVHGEREVHDPVVQHAAPMAVALTAIVAIPASITVLRAPGRTSSTAEAMVAVALFALLAVWYLPFLRELAAAMVRRQILRAALMPTLTSLGMLLGAVLTRGAIWGPPLGGILAVALVIRRRRTRRLLARRWWHPEMADVFLVTILTSFPVTMRLAIERLIVPFGGEGLLASLDYAEKLTLSFGVGALFVSLAGLVGLQNTNTRRQAILVASATAPLAAGVALFAEPLVRVLFERGSFDPESTASVSRLVRELSMATPIVAALPILLAGQRIHRRFLLVVVGGSSLLHVIVAIAVAAGGPIDLLPASFVIMMYMQFALLMMHRQPELRRATV